LTRLGDKKFGPLIRFSEENYAIHSSGPLKHGVQVFTRIGFILRGRRGRRIDLLFADEQAVRLVRKNHGFFGV
jgi:hypothetical protein